MKLKLEFNNYVNFSSALHTLKSVSLISNIIWYYVYLMKWNETKRNETSAGFDRAQW
jgi:hypothetical protein